MTKYGYPCNIIVGGMQNNFSNMMTFGQTQILPRLTIVTAFIHPDTAVRRVVAVYFVCIYLNGLGVLVNRHIANAECIFFIKNEYKINLFK